MQHAITKQQKITAKPDLMPVKPLDCFLALGALLGAVAPLGAVAFVVAICL